jgi:hypothetical protein
MFTQPSPEKIASTYQGNPAPLARKVDQDKKQNGGIPKDLRQLMALNDIAEGKESAGIQQALQIPTNMPTVAQNTQQLAQQALQARMLQQVREQQRLQQKPPTLPLGTPQPEEQPQGIDALSTNVGEGYAEGGIIGFDGTGSSQFVRDVAALPEAFDEMKQRVREEDAVKKAQDLRMAQRKQEALDARSKTSFFNYLFGSPEREKEGETKLTELSTAPLNAPAKPPATAATPLANIRSQLNVADAESRAQPGTPPPPRERPAAQTQTRVNTDSAPMPAGLQGLASSLATPGLDYQRKQLNQDENALAAAKRALYDKEVGARDLSIYDRTAAELEARKQKLNAPKAGYDAMMEYLEQIALGGGRTSAESGSLGAARQRQLQLTREGKQNELMDKILELGAKKSDAMFAEKKGMFDLTQAEKDRVIKEKSEAAQKLGLSEDETRKLIEQSLQKELDRKNELRKAGISASAANRDDLLGRALLIKKDNPTISMEEAIKRASVATYAGQLTAAEGKSDTARDQRIAKIRENYGKTMKFLKPDSPLYKRQQALMDQEIADERGTPGLNALPGAASSGTVPPPPGFRVN